eukprot:425406-Amphidinium_carterae.1
MVRSEQNEGYPTKFWTLSSHSNPQGFMGAISDFLALEDTSCLDTGHALPLWHANTSKRDATQVSCSRCVFVMLGCATLFQFVSIQNSPQNVGNGKVMYSCPNCGCAPLRMNGWVHAR